MTDTRPAWQRRGIVPAPETNEREQRARAVAKELGETIAGKLEPGARLEPGKAVIEHLGAEALLRHARELGVNAEDLRCWIMAAAIGAWPAK